MDVCKDNSTECLLRKLYEDTLKFDWDPLTFGLTVAIGALAFIVACMTVFQGALASGPGRIKASSRAIGDWSQYSHSRFDRKELRVRTTTLVPFIEIFNISGSLSRSGSRTTDQHADIVKLINNDQKSRFLKERMIAVWKRGTRRFHIPSAQTKPAPAMPTGDFNARNFLSTNYAASWANLLAHLPRSKDFFISHNWRGISTLKALLCEADYLPSDVPAAVAAGIVRSIITVAAFAGCDEIYMINQLPEARGNSIQLSFREHALLGTVAVAQELPMQDTYRSDFDREIWDLKLSHDHFMAPKFLGLKATMIILYTKSPPWLRAVTFSSMKFLAVAKYMCTKAAPWLKLDARSIICAIHKHVTKHGGSLYVDGRARSQIFHRELPDVTANYSSDRRGWFGLPQINGTCYQKSMYWEDGGVFGHSQQTLNPRALIDGNIVVIRNIAPVTGRLLHEMMCFETDLDVIDNLLSGKEPSSTNLLTKVAEEKPFLVLLPLALKCCLDFVEDKFMFHDLSFNLKSSTRGALRHQLHEIDHWLLRHDREAAVEECRARLEDAPKEEEQLSTGPKWQKQEQRSMQEALKSTKDTDLIPTILAFRAVLLAAFLSTAADVSCVTGTALGRRVVQFL